MKPREVSHYYIPLLLICCCFLVGGVLVTMKQRFINNNESSIETSAEAESVTEPQSAKTNAIKVAILKKYPGAEIINTTDSAIGYFIYEQERYSFESENNVLFISKDNKTIDFIYLD